MSEGAGPDSGYRQPPKKSGEYLMEELPDRFTYHPPSPEGVDRHAALTGMFIECASSVVATCPIGRELSLALTKLEEAKFWASAAVARNPDTR